MYICIMLGYLAQITSVFLFGVSNSLWAKPIRVIPFYLAIFYRTLVSFSFFAILVIVFDFSVNASFTSYLNTFFLASIASFGLYFFTKGISMSSTSLVVTITASSFLFGQLTSIFILGENPKPLHLLTIILFLGAIILTDWKSVVTFKITRGTKFGLLAALIWGVTFPLLSVSSKSIGFIQTSFIVETCVLIMSLFFSLKLLRSLKSPNPINLIWFFSLGILAALGLLLQYFAYTLIPVHKAVAISSLTHLIAIASSVLFFKETVNNKIKIAAFLGALGVISTIL